MLTYLETTRSRLYLTCLAGVFVVAAGIGSAAGEEVYGTLKRINDANSITIGHRESSAPFSFYNEKKEPVGYAMDLCNSVVDEVRRSLNKPNLQIKYLPVTAQNRITMVADRTVDMECGSTTNTLTRQQQVDFSAVYFTTGTRVLTRKALKAKEIEDLQGKTIGVVGGSTNERAVKALLDDGRLKNVSVTAVKEYSDGIAALEKGTLDAFVTDDIVLYGLMAKSSAKDELEVIGRFLTYDPYGIMIARDDSAFRLVVNRALARLFRSGEIDKLYAKWFDPLAVPMSPLLKASFELQALPE